jgi:hypothetical protein
MSLVNFVLLVLSFYLHEHVVDPMNLVSKSCVLFTHVVLQVHELGRSNCLANWVLNKVLGVYLFLHVVGILILVLMVHEHC